MRLNINDTFVTITLLERTKKIKYFNFKIIDIFEIH